MGINLSKANKQFRDSIANYKLGAFQLADEQLKLRKDISAFQTCIESNQELIEKATSETKKADLQAEIDTFVKKIADRQKRYKATTEELEKRIAPFYALTQSLYDNYVNFRNNADIAGYKKSVKAWLDNNGVTADDKTVTLIATAVGVKAKSARAMYKDHTGMTTNESAKKFRDLLARTLVDLAGEQLPAYNWTYKPVKKA